MVIWCKTCGALIGLREPVDDWSVDRTAICLACAAKQSDLKKPAASSIEVHGEPIGSDQEANDASPR